MAAAPEIASVVRRLGQEISHAFPDGALLVAVMRGSVPFVADLARTISAPIAVDFLAISTYAPGTGRVRLTKDLDCDVQGRDVVLVEDLVDTGLTLNYVMTELAGRGPRSLSACALLNRARRRLVPTDLRFVGLEVDEDLILGYGLEYGGIYPNAAGIYDADLHRLRSDRHTYVPQLFPPTPED
ncbi:MAG TPA: phosphoribosyltransferase family protein [Acidimicrobiales bacterium]|nr:phosphoribosyltransferase family protein [Acidimicrobiales bacterium]